jgi:Protein of unknown function (DUF2786)
MDLPGGGVRRGGPLSLAADSVRRQPEEAATAAAAAQRLMLRHRIEQVEVERLEADQYHLARTSAGTSMCPLAGV